MWECAFDVQKSERGQAGFLSKSKSEKATRDEVELPDCTHHYKDFGIYFEWTGGIKVGKSQGVSSIGESACS